MRRQALLIALACALHLGALPAAPARGQCILANPSFEMGGSGGAVFGGWNQFGTVGAASDAAHGAWAARVSGPGGDWGVSGYWQRLDCAPGERWQVTGTVRHPGSKPLTAQCAAIVNVEWRDGGGQLIDYDSFAVADAGTPTGEHLAFAVLSDPAPAGTVAIHLLLGVLQSPGAPSPDVDYDQITCYSTSSPTMDELQWNDFPGGRTLDFAGRSWRVKGPGYYGPGPNVFCDEPICVWVDAQDRLHLTLAQRSGTWKSTEVVLEEALGYGDYVFTTIGRLDALDPAAVLGLFIWQYGPCWDDAYLWWNPYDEIDIEYSRWGNPSGHTGQFVAQPYDYPGNLEPFSAVFAEGERTSHAFRWLADRVEYRAWRGGPAEEATAPLIHSWTYGGPHIPRPEQPRVHLNLWKLPELYPAAAQEVVIESFRFLPPGGGSGVDAGDPLPAAALARLAPPVPNPFNPETTIRFELSAAGPVELAIVDLTGRRVRRLAAGEFGAGPHALRWDGRDDAGRSLASGVYLIRLAGPGFAAARHAVLLK